MSVSTSDLAATGTSPTARRARRPGWRDPRLAVGLALVCLSVLLGARLLARADDTVPVLAATGALVAGQQVTSGDLTTVRLRFSSADDANRYVGATDGLIDGTAVLVRDVGAGELLPRAALRVGGRSTLVELPLAVDSANTPSSVSVGSHVDVWVTGTAPASASGSRSGSGSDSATGSLRAQRVLADVPVIAETSLDSATASGTRQVVVGLSGTEQGRLPVVVAALADNSVLLVRQPD